MPSRPLPAELRSVPAFSRAYARTSGITDEQLRQRRLTRISQGWYTDGLDAADLAQRCAALLATLPAGCVFSDATAAQLYGLPVPAAFAASDAPVHVTLNPGGSPPRRRELVVHQRLTTDGDTASADGIPVTTADRTFADLAMVLSAEQLAVVGDAALRAGLATPEALQQRIDSLRRRRGLTIARAVLPLLDGRAESPPETIVRLRLAAAGLPAEPQCPVRDARGKLLGHADLGYPEALIALEYEGRHHADGDQFDYDLDRYSLFAAAGWLVIRCGRRHLADGSTTLIARVRAALASRVPRR